MCSHNVDDREFGCWSRYHLSSKLKFDLYFVGAVLPVLLVAVVGMCSPEPSQMLHYSSCPSTWNPYHIPT